MGAMLSIAYGAINGHTAFGIFALMRQIKDSSQVAATSSLGMQLRCVSAVGLSLGAVLFGGRIVPVTGELWLASAKGLVHVHKRFGVCASFKDVCCWANWHA